jgi:hypothetical protein
MFPVSHGQTCRVNCVNCFKLLSCLAYSSSLKVEDVSQQRQLTLNGLQGGMSQNAELLTLRFVPDETRLQQIR